jgi:hypothetical protein
MKKRLISLVLLMAAMQSPVFAQMVQPTRFGLLEANSEHILQLNGQPFDANVLLERPEYTMVRFEQDDADVIFLRQNQSSDCPQKFAIVRVTHDGAKGLNDLGTCSSKSIVPSIDANQTIHFSQPEAQGQGVVRYEYDRNGVLTQTRESSSASKL